MLLIAYAYKFKKSQYFIFFPFPCENDIVQILSLATLIIYICEVIFIFSSWIFWINFFFLLVAFHIQVGSKSGGESTDSGLSSKTEPPFEAESPISKKASSSDHHQAFDQQHLQHRQQLQQEMASDAPRAASSQNQSAAKSPQEKVSLSLSFFHFFLFSLKQTDTDYL